LISLYSFTDKQTYKKIKIERNMKTEKEISFYTSMGEA